MTPYVRAWLIAFIFTQVVEVPIYRKAFRCNVLVAFGASAITHPIVWFVIFSPAFAMGYTARVVVSELFAWLVEAAYFAFLFHKKRALFWSLVANGASCGLGLASRALFGFP